MNNHAPPEAFLFFRRAWGGIVGNLPGGASSSHVRPEDARGLLADFPHVLAIVERGLRRITLV